MTRRQQRLNVQIREEISELLLRQVKDPRLSDLVSLVSVTEVSLSADMKHATVFISVMGDEAQKTSVLQGMAAAAGYLRRELSPRLSLRQVPELTFLQDNSIERGVQLLELIRKVSTSKAENQGGKPKSSTTGK